MRIRIARILVFVITAAIVIFSLLFAWIQSAN